MATTLYFRSISTPSAWCAMSISNGYTRLDGQDGLWCGNLGGPATPLALVEAIGDASQTAAYPGITTVSGNTTGLELGTSTSRTSYFWLSPPLAAAVTISGTVSFSFRGYESSMSANAALGCSLRKVTGKTMAVSAPFLTAKDDAELSTSESTVTWTGSPTSTSFAKGDRIMGVPYVGNYGTMGDNYSVWFVFNDFSNPSSVTFTETITFMSFSGAQYLYPTYVTSDVATADVDYKIWTSRGT